MKEISDITAKRIKEDLKKSYMEIIPVPGIEDKVDALPSDMYIAVTCSPTKGVDCLLYTSPSPRDVEESRMPSSA